MTDESMMESVILHLVLPLDLNHHGTLFAGQMTKWLVEAGLLTVSRLIGKPEDIVCLQLNDLIFRKPINNGELIEIRTRVAHLGFTSITICSEVFRKQNEAPVVSNFATFVTVDKLNKPYAHGLKLTKEYIADNQDIYKLALKMRRRR